MSHIANLHLPFGLLLCLQAMLVYLDGFTVTPPTLDVTDDDTFNQSMTRVKDLLSKKQRDELVDALKLISRSPNRF